MNPDRSATKATNHASRRETDLVTHTLTRLMFAGLCVACSCAAGPDRDMETTPCAGVRIAVPAHGVADAMICWLGKEVAVDVLSGPLRIKAEARRILVEGVWGVDWRMGADDQARFAQAVRAHGEAYLMFEGRPFTWAWVEDGVSPRGTFVNWSSLGEQGAMDLAARVSGLGR